MKIVNVKDYGGIANAIKAGVIYCGRPSPLGNPCSIPNIPCPVCEAVHFGTGMKQLTPCRSIECYRKWLWEKLKGKDAVIIRELNKLACDSVIGCWCKPNSCHLDVVERAWKWMNS